MRDRLACSVVMMNQWMRMTRLLPATRVRAWTPNSRPRVERGKGVISDNFQRSSNDTMPRSLRRGLWRTDGEIPRVLLLGWPPRKYQERRVCG